LSKLTEKINRVTIEYRGRLPGSDPRLPGSDPYSAGYYCAFLNRSYKPTLEIYVKEYSLTQEEAKTRLEDWEMGFADGSGDREMLMLEDIETGQ
jgi:hypothetical protein